MIKITDFILAKGTSSHDDKIVIIWWFNYLFIYLLVCFTALDTSNTKWNNNLKYQKTYPTKLKSCVKPHANEWGMLGASTHSLWWHKGGSRQILTFTWTANPPDELWERGSDCTPCCEPMRSWASQMNTRIKYPQLELFGA